MIQTVFWGPYFPLRTVVYSAMEEINIYNFVLTTSLILKISEFWVLNSSPKLHDAPFEYQIEPINVLCINITG